MTKDELLDLILLNIERLGIVMNPTTLDQYAIINCEKYIGVYDPVSITPFILAHELIHAKYRDKQRHCDNDILSFEEKRANKEAILLLWEIYTEQGGNSDYFTNFIEVSGCPFESSITYIKETDNILECLSSEEDHYPMFEGDLRDCAVDYISQFDVIDIIKVYDFLELYNLSYDLYDAAVDEFQNLSDQQNLAY
jgi:hypothetical protein